MARGNIRMTVSIEWVHSQRGQRHYVQDRKSLKVKWYDRAKTKSIRIIVN